jgi:hypothetical protein
MTFVLICMQLALTSAEAHVVQHGPSAHTDMRRLSWGQSAQTTTREVSFALLLMDTQCILDNALVPIIRITG